MAPRLSPKALAVTDRTVMKNFAMTPYPQSVVDCDPPFALPMVDELTRKQRERESRGDRQQSSAGEQQGTMLNNSSRSKGIDFAL
jgi:hypothetical protein